MAQEWQKAMTIDHEIDIEPHNYEAGALPAIYDLMQKHIEDWIITHGEMPKRIVLHPVDYYDLLIDPRTQQFAEIHFTKPPNTRSIFIFGVEISPDPLMRRVAELPQVPA